jgi:hypothetical protein
MSRPDFVTATLDIIESNWDTSAYSPRPILVDGRSRRRRDTGDRDATIDLTENAVITVNGPVTVDDSPLGTEFDLDFREAVSVHFEGAHFEDRGTVGGPNTPASVDWNEQVDELLRALYESRIRPTSDDRVRDLRVTNQSDNSTAGRGLFQFDLDVEYRGREALP